MKDSEVLAVVVWNGIDRVTLVNVMEGGILGIKGVESPDDFDALINSMFTNPFATIDVEVHESEYLDRVAIMRIGEINPGWANFAMNYSPN